MLKKYASVIHGWPFCWNLSAIPQIHTELIFLYAIFRKRQSIILRIHTGEFPVWMENYNYISKYYIEYIQLNLVKLSFLLKKTPTRILTKVLSTK